MAGYWSDLGGGIANRVSEGSSGIGNALGAFGKAEGFMGFIGAVQGLSKSINDFFNKGKPLQFPVFNINEFKSSFISDKDGDVARNNLFEVILSPPGALNSAPKSGTNTSGTVAGLLVKRIEQVTLPSKSISTKNVYTYGPQRKIATGNNYSDIDITMIVSESMKEREVIINWMEAIQPSMKDKHDGDVSYYDDYCGRMEIRVYDQDGNNPRLQTTLYEVYPINMTETNLSWGDNNKYMTLRVKFAFRHFNEVYNKKGEPLKDESLIGLVRGFANDVRSLVTDIRNLRYNFKQVKSNLKDLRKTLSNDLKSGDPLSKIEAIAAAPANIMGAISDSAFKLLDRSSSGSIGSVMNNASKFFN